MENEMATVKTNTANGVIMKSQKEIYLLGYNKALNEILSDVKSLDCAPHDRTETAKALSNNYINRRDVENALYIRLSRKPDYPDFLTKI
jgi:hypothetical protein